MPEELRDFLASTTLNGSILSGASSLIVTSAANFPSSGTFDIRIDDEIITVTAVSGTTFTISRGAGTPATTAAAHSSGATVKMVLTKRAVEARGVFLLSRTVLGAPAANVDVTGISASYEDLIIVVMGRSAIVGTFDEVKFRFNNDSGNNYDTQQTESHGTTVAGAEDLTTSAGRAGWLAGSTAPANEASCAEIVVFGYARTVFQKCAHWRGTVKLANTSGNTYVAQGASYWRDTSAINRVTIYLTASNLDTGTVVSIYGRI